MKRFNFFNMIMTSFVIINAVIVGIGAYCWISLEPTKQQLISTYNNVDLYADEIDYDELTFGLIEKVDKQEEIIEENKLSTELRYCSASIEKAGIENERVIFRYSEDSLDRGYIEARGISDCDVNVSFYAERSEIYDYVKDCRDSDYYNVLYRYQFNLHNFDDDTWVMLPLPFQNNKVFVYDRNIKTSRTLNFRAGDWLMNPDEQNTKLEDAGAFRKPTTWLWWKPDSGMVNFSREMRGIYLSDLEFIEACILEARDSISYNYDLRDLITSDDYSKGRNQMEDLILSEEEFLKGNGVCSDISAMAVIMLRAQGFDAEYLSGVFSNDINDTGVLEDAYHAIIRVNDYCYACPTSRAMFEEPTIYLDGWKTLAYK